MLEAFSLAGKIIIDGIDKIDGILQDIDKKGEKVADTFNSIGDKVTDTGDRASAMDKIDSSLNLIDRAANKTRETFDKVSDSISKTGNKAPELGKLEDVLEKVKNKAKEVEERFSKLSKSLKNVGKNMMKYITLPVTGIATAITKLGMDFKQVMAEVQAISGAAGEELAKLEEKARELGATTRFSASQAAEALKYMAMAGWQTEQMLSGIDGVLALAAASGEDLARVSDIVTDALTAFGMEASQAIEFADLLASASANANTNVSMLGESFKYVAPLFGSLGYSAEDAALSLGLMANAGIKGSQAGTALRAAITNLINPTDDAVAIMNKLGIQLTDSSGKMLPFVEVMDQLRSSFANLNEEQQGQYAATLFGQQAMSGMLAIINAGEEDYKKLTEATREYTGAAQEMADIMSDTLKGKIDEFKSALEEVGLQLYEHIEPVLVSIVEKATELVTAFGELPAGTQKAIAGLAAFMAILGPIIMVLGAIAGSIQKIAWLVPKLGSIIGGVVPFLGKVAGLLAQIGPFIAKIIGFIKAAGAAIAAVGAGPIAAIIAIIGVVIGLATLLIKNWDKVKDFFGNLWEGIKEGFSNFIGWFKEGWESIKEFLSNFNLFEIGKNIISSLWEGIKSFFSNLWEGAKGIGKGLINIFKSIFGIASPSKVFQDIGGDIGEGLELGILDSIDGVEDAAKNMADSIGRIKFSMDDFEKEMRESFEKSLKEREAQKLQTYKVMNQRLKKPTGVDYSGISGLTTEIAGATQEVIHKHEGTINVEFLGEFIERTVEIVMERLIRDQRLELRRA